MKRKAPRKRAFRVSWAEKEFSGTYTAIDVVADDAAQAIEKSKTLFDNSDIKKLSLIPLKVECISDNIK